MGERYWERKPVGQTILAKVARDLALRKAGIDPRTPEEIAKDNEDRRNAAREFDKYNQDHQNDLA